MTDSEIIEKANAIMAAKFINRANLAKEVGTTRYKLDCLSRDGLIKLPAALSNSQAARVGRSIHKKTEKHFVINPSKPQIWQ